MTVPSVTRRSLLLSGGALVAWAYVPRIASAGPSRDPRFVAIVLRGGLDGLAAVAPVGDPDYARVRGGLGLATDGPDAGRRLDDVFLLNPNMPALAALYGRGEALVVHAVATPYRDRSHFDGQDVLESGQDGPGMTGSGWLNRALGLLPKGAPVAGRTALALGAEIPLVVRGAAPVATLMPPGGFDAPEDTRRRLLDLYTHTDPELAVRMEEGLALRARLAEADRMAPASPRRLPGRSRNAGRTAGRLLALADGPRIGAIGLNGWDTHRAEGLLDGQLGRALAELDETIDGLRESLGEAWRETVVVVMTEFGRTARMNGTEGTDHGTATVAFVVGGAVAGGRVVADWPGLSASALHEGRDLAPTTDLRAVLKGLLADHLGVPRRLLDAAVFPGSGGVVPLAGLVKV
jgi:uncharacterized protein (DUF1501 family)